MKIITNNICRKRYKIQAKVKKRLKAMPARGVAFFAVALVVTAISLIFPEGGQSPPQVTLPQTETLPKPHPELAEESPVAEQTFEERNKDKNSIFLLYETIIEVNEDWSYTKKIHKIF